MALELEKDTLAMMLRTLAISVLTTLTLSSASHGAEPQWGPTKMGLRCRFEMGDTALQGEVIPVSLHLTFEPATAGEISRLVHMLARDCSRLEFLDAAGNVQVRSAQSKTRIDTPVGWPGDPYLDLRKPLEISEILVPLLSREGDQLAPGRYTVTAVYENRAWHGSQAPDSTILSTVWSGALRSAPLPLTIMEALPTTIEFDVFTAAELVGTGREWSWRWDPATRHRAVALVRPGFKTGRQVNLYRGTKLRASEMSIGEALDSQNVDYAGLGTVQPAASDSLWIELFVFETSADPGHRWSPGRGDDRVLWKQTTLIRTPNSER